MGTVISEFVWIKSFLTAIGIFHTSPMQLFCENQVALHISKNSLFHERTKHIEIDCHFVRECLLSDELTTGYMSSKNQVADIFTKAFGRQHQLLQGNLRILNIYAPP